MKHPEQDAATNEALTAAVTSRLTTGHLHIPTAAWTRMGFRRTLFLSACGPLWE
jgi:hypothetical protein